MALSVTPVSKDLFELRFEITLLEKWKRWQSTRYYLVWLVAIYFIHLCSGRSWSPIDGSLWVDTGRQQMNPLKIVPSAQWWWLSLSAGVHDASPFLDLPLSWGGAEQDRAWAKGRTWQQSSCEGFKTRSEA